MSAAGRETAPVELTGIGVRYRIPTERIASFKEYVLHRLRRRIEYHVLWALEDVSVCIQRGEVFGVIGRNGAGKSTLLKVISRVVHPTCGRVIVRGGVAPLLELGAGFHPDLTGRENVILNSTILGHAKAKVERRIDELVDFAELQQFIDAPIRTYSSGMVARLGFAAATQFRPDLLLVDEVLSVGDMGFQEKCLSRIQRFRELGTTIVMVSHSAETLRAQCQNVLWLDHGRVAAVGAPDEVLARYSEAIESQRAEL